MIYTHLARRLPRELKSNLFRYLSLLFILILGIYLVASFSISYDTMVVMTERTAKECCLEDGNFSLFFALSDEQVGEITDSGVTLEDQTYMDIPLESVSDDCVLRAMQRWNFNDKTGELEEAKINKVAIDSGKRPENAGEIVLEKNFANKHNYKIGSSLSVKESVFTVVGLGVVPDYNLVLRNLSDSAGDPTHFGIAFFHPDGFKALATKNIAPLNYNYSFILGKSTYDKLKTQLVKMDFNYKDVDDVYFQEAIELRIKDQRALLNSLSELSDGMATFADGVGEFKQGVEAISDNLHLITENIGEFNKIVDAAGSGVDGLMQTALDTANNFLEQNGYEDAGPLTKENYESVLGELIKNEADADKKTALEQTKNLIDKTALASSTASIYMESIKNLIDSIQSDPDGEGKQILTDSLTTIQKNVDTMYNGAVQLQKGTQKIKNETEKALDNQINASVNNLTNFLKRSDNPRIMASRARAASYRAVIWIIGIILLILVSYVLSIFVIQQLNREIKTIGALYALGLTRKELTAHYITLATIITTVGAILGMVLAVTPLRIDAYSIMASSCSVLSPRMVILPYIIIGCIVLPPVISIIVNLLSIGKQLNKPALTLLNNSVEKTAKKSKKPKKLRLAPRLKFIQMFQLRQLARESRTGSTIIFGIFNCILVIMLGLSMQFMSFNLINNTTNNLNYDYMYVLKYPTAQVRVEAEGNGAEAIFQKVLNITSSGKTANINIIGVDNDNNKFFPAISGKGYNELTISSALASKYYLKKGSSIIMSDAGEQHDYVFYVSDIVDYNVGVCAFMDIGSMRELFNMPVDYYNMLVSNKKLNVEEGRTYSVVTKEQIVTTAAQMKAQVQSMVYMAISVGFLIMVLVMYILTGVMIDRAAVGVSLTRIFGYNEKEVRKLFINGNYIIVGVGAALAVPISILVSRWLVNFATLNFNIGVNIFMPWWAYIVFFGIVMLSYVGVSALVQRKLKKIPLTEALKSRG